SEQKSIGRRETSETMFTIERLAEAGVQIVEYVHGRSLTPKSWIDKMTTAVLSVADEGTSGSRLSAVTRRTAGSAHRVASAVARLDAACASRLAADLARPDRLHSSRRRLRLRRADALRPVVLRRRRGREAPGFHPVHARGLRGHHHRGHVRWRLRPDSLP